MVGFKANQIRTVPASSLPPALRWLILTDNQITELPVELGRCSQLQKLMLAGNQLQALPSEMAACKQLELLRIAANRLTALPDWLFQLPRLCWLGYAGNPFCDDNEVDLLVHSPIAHIRWDSLQIQHKLGEGASGVIHQAIWRHDDKHLDVAVKLFKGALTSDGLPHSEMAACICAGDHPNLIAVYGKIVGHPNDESGMVMERVDNRYRNLAGPPSLASCTRDIYATDTTFTLSTVIRIACGIASAAQHLHQQGIMHGDLYAHNILRCDEGEALLGDFGAASFYATENQPRAEALQRIEVRAFACLLEELLDRCDAPDDKRLTKLREFQSRCAQQNIAVRPLFAEIKQVLESL
jgi:hypothetical protein